MLIRYYKLKETKNMQDSHSIEEGQVVSVIKEEGGKLFVETEDDSDIKRVFWVNENEVEFLKQEERELTEKEKTDREILINGNFLTLI